MILLKPVICVLLAFGECKDEDEKVVENAFVNACTSLSLGKEERRKRKRNDEEDGVVEERR